MRSRVTRLVCILMYWIIARGLLVGGNLSPLDIRERRVKAQEETGLFMASGLDPPAEFEQGWGVGGREPL